MRDAKKNSRIKKWSKALMIFAAVLMSIVAAGPWGLYGLGLDNIDGKPSPPVATATPEQIRQAWAEAQGIGVPEIPVMSPHGVLVDFLLAGYGYESESRDRRKAAAERIVHWVASRYNLEHRKEKGNLRWHLSNAAMAIWLTRHWTQEQIFSKAVELGFRRQGSGVR